MTNKKFTAENGVRVSEHIGYVEAFAAADGFLYGFLPVSDEDKIKITYDPHRIMKTCGLENQIEVNLESRH